MRRPPVSKKTEGYTKTVTIWMRPEVAKRLKVVAANEETTVQAIVDEAVTRYLTAPAFEPEPVNA